MKWQINTAMSKARDLFWKRNPRPINEAYDFPYVDVKSILSNFEVEPEADPDFYKLEYDDGVRLLRVCFNFKTWSVTELDLGVEGITFSPKGWMFKEVEKYAEKYLKECENHLKECKSIQDTEDHIRKNLRYW